MSRMALTVIALCVMTLVIPANTVCADEVLDWNAHAAKAIVTVGGQVPPRALIRLAMVHLAIYDAVQEGVISKPTRIFAPGFGAGAVGGYAVLRIDPAIVATSAAAITPRARGPQQVPATSSDDVRAAFGD